MTENQPIEYTGQLLTEADIGKTFIAYGNHVIVRRIIPHELKEKIRNGIIKAKK